MKIRENCRIITIVVIVILIGCVFLHFFLMMPEKPTIAYQEFPEVHVMIASDLHYLSPLLTDHGEYFTELIEHSDGKIMEYSEELIEAFAETVIKNKPDVLVLTGDLTFNGAKTSHEDLVQKLTEIESMGISVVVLSGNHDLNNHNAASFTGNSYEFVPNISRMEFEELYEPFGFREAISHDVASSSYIWKCTNGLQFLILDVNGVDEPGKVPEETLDWLEKQLKDAKKSGNRVIAFSHQNLLKHSLFETGYVIENSELVLQLYQKYGVSINFTGHLHIQHIAEQNGFYEVATSALSVSPNQYGDIVVNVSELTYESSSVDVAAWAREQRLNQEELLDFKNYARDFFMDTSYEQAVAELYGMVDEGLKDSMAEYFSKLNYAYFSGSLDGIEREEHLQEKWQQSGTFTGRYLESIFEEIPEDQNHIVLKFQ